jgi:hypothetical protein
MLDYLFILSCYISFAYILRMFLTTSYIEKARIYYFNRNNIEIDCISDRFRYIQIYISSFFEELAICYVIWYFWFK